MNLLKLKKLLVHCSVTVLLLMCMSTAFNPEYSVFASEKASYTEDGGAVIYAEQTEWRYRVVDGKPQKRLWSITYGIWLTDWEWL